MAEIFTMLIISVVANVMVILFANGWTEKKGSSLNRTAHCNERDPPPEVALWGGGACWLWHTSQAFVYYH